VREFIHFRVLAHGTPKEAANAEHRQKWCQRMWREAGFSPHRLHANSQMSESVLIRANLCPDWILLCGLGELCGEMLALWFQSKVFNAGQKGLVTDAKDFGCPLPVPLGLRKGIEDGVFLGL
jgi:hypothetical protein